MGADQSASVDSPERFDPDVDSGKLVHAEHAARYEWAAGWVAGRDVLDAGSGVGYGTVLLSAAGPASIRALDADPEAVAATGRRIGEDLVDQGDIRALPYPDDSFDLVVCFEVIEHVTQPERALAEFARVLRPGGLVILSSPNRGVYLPGNPHHVHEFTPEELEAELLRHFSTVRLAGQYAWTSTLLCTPEQLADLAADAAPLRARLLLEPTADPDRDPTFVLAIAGNREPEIHDGLLALVEPFEAKWWQDRVDAAETGRWEQERLEARLAEVDARRRDAQARLLDAEQDLGAARARVARLEAELGDAHQAAEQARAAQDARITELAAHAEDLTARLLRSQELGDAMRRSISWRVTKPLRWLKRSH